MAPLLLGLDLGTTAIKALLVDGEGRPVAAGRVATPFPTGGPAAEMGVERLLEAVSAALDALATDLGGVAAVGIAGMAESGAPVGPAGEPLGPVIGWHDPRGQVTVDILHDRLGDDLDRRIGQRLRTVSSVAKLGWLVGEGGLGRVPRWLGVPELCLHRLTGAMATEVSLAARTGAYDVARRAYLPEVLAVLGLDVSVLPPVAAAGAVMGRVSADGARWSGLRAGVPVTLAGHDHLAGVVGAGAAPDDLVNSVGTAETVVARSAALPDVDGAMARRAAVTVAPGGAHWAVLVSAGRAGHVLGPVARSLGRSPAELDELAAAAAAAAGVAEVGDGRARVDAGPLVERLLAGEPWELPAGEPGEVWNAVLWTMASRTWEAVDRLVSLLGPARRLVVVGGGGASRPWMEAKAALATLPVWRSAAIEAVARGAALFAGQAAGWWPSPAGAPRPGLVRVPGPGPAGPAGPVGGRAEATRGP